jgi:hypothetical protein
LLVHNILPASTAAGANMTAAIDKPDAVCDRRCIRSHPMTNAATHRVLATLEPVTAAGTIKAALATPVGKGVLKDAFRLARI